MSTAIAFERLKKIKEEKGVGIKEIWVKDKLLNKKPYEKIVCAYYTYPQSLNEYGYILGGAIYAYKDNYDLIIYQYNDEISLDYLSLYIKLCKDRHIGNMSTLINISDLDFDKM